MLGWGRVKFILQSQPRTHLLALSGLFPILERGSEVSQPMQVSRQDGQLPTEPPMHAGLEGASLHPVHAPIQACTRVSGHVFAHESVHQPSTTTSPRGSSSTRAGWGAACPSARPLHPTLDQSCLHPTSQSLWTSGFQLSCIQSAGKRTPRPPQCMPLGTAGGGPRSPRGADKRVQGTGPWQCQAGCPPHAAPGIQPCAWGGGAEGGACTRPDPGAVTFRLAERRSRGRWAELGGHWEQVRATFGDQAPPEGKWLEGTWVQDRAGKKQGEQGHPWELGSPWCSGPCRRIWACPSPSGTELGHPQTRHGAGSSHGVPVAAPQLLHAAAPAARDPDALGKCPQGGRGWGGQGGSESGGPLPVMTTSGPTSPGERSTRGPGGVGDPTGSGVPSVFLSPPHPSHYLSPSQPAGSGDTKLHLLSQELRGEDLLKGSRHRQGGR